MTDERRDDPSESAMTHRKGGQCVAVGSRFAIRCLDRLVGTKPRRHGGRDPLPTYGRKRALSRSKLSLKSMMVH